MQLISDIVEVYDNYPALSTEVLVASVRSPMHVLEAAKMGADVFAGYLLALFNRRLLIRTRGVPGRLAENRPDDPLASHDQDSPKRRLMAGRSRRQR